MKRIVMLMVVAFLSGLGGSYCFSLLNKAKNQADGTDIAVTPSLTKYSKGDASDRPIIGGTLNTRVLSTDQDFVEASQKSTQSVVFIKTMSGTEYGRGSWLDWFFEGGSSQRSGSGSGVIYAEDGYIVTNNHVVDDAEIIEVIHNKVSYDAQVIGSDPSSDIAVLKVDGTGFPAIAFGNSQQLKVGEWVLAVGNPFNLTSTVTAGIVSAKGRDINILKGRFPLESFIQTDAAINPGNSGGALVNIKGELVGINTAILSKTGSYAGYGFAVPVDIVKKVANDLIAYGETQKAFFGADVVDISPEIAEAVGVKLLNGVALSYIRSDGAAEKGGLKKGDIILSINKNKVNSKSQFDEQMSYFSPGDKVEVSYKRKSNQYNVILTLTNSEGTTSLVRKEVFASKTLGVDFESVSGIEKSQLGVENGIRVAKIKSSGFFRKLGIPEGFIITSVNSKEVGGPEELARLIEELEGRVRIEGINEKGVRGYYSYYF